jgi:hypothetical protein
MSGAADPVEQKKIGREALAGLAVFFLYVLVLAAAAVSEVFGLGWFDHPIFK